jgi:hypothetical protein
MSGGAGGPRRPIRRSAASPSADLINKHNAERRRREEIRDEMRKGGYPPSGQGCVMLVVGLLTSGLLFGLLLWVGR